MGSYVLASISPHFFLLLSEYAAALATCALALTLMLARLSLSSLSLFLWELLHAPEGISHRMPAFLPFVGNIFFKLALSSFEGNPDIVGKRVRGQPEKKGGEGCFFLSLL